MHSDDDLCVILLLFNHLVRQKNSKNLRRTTKDYQVKISKKELCKNLFFIPHSYVKIIKEMWAYVNIYVIVSFKKIGIFTNLVFFVCLTQETNSQNFFDNPGTGISFTCKYLLICPWESIITLQKSVTIFFNVVRMGTDSLCIRNAMKWLTIWNVTIRKKALW